MTKRQRTDALSATSTLTACAALLLALAGSSAAAETTAGTNSDSPDTLPPNVFTYTSARLAGVPETFRLHPRAPDATASTAVDRIPASLPQPAARARVRAAHLAAAEARFVDRSAVINRLKELDSLQLIRFWESQELCLYLGVSDRGFAGLNLTRRRAPDAGGDDEADDADRARRLAVTRFVELTGERAPTFPQPPSIHASLAAE